MSTTHRGDEDTEPPPLSPEAASVFPPLGFWATILWLAIALVISVVTVTLLLLLTGLVFDIDRVSDASFVETMTPIVALIFVGVLVWKVRRIQWSPRDYFALARPTRRALMIAVIGACVLALIEVLPTLYFDTDWGNFGTGLTDFRAVRAAGPALVALYIFNILLLTPVIEEIVFRGFLYRGWSAPPIDPRRAIVLTALAFGAAHLQYSWLGMLNVGLSGLFLGWLRWRSDSVIPPMLSHASMNAIALISFVLAV